MKKQRLISLLLIIFIITSSLFNCKTQKTIIDNSVVNHLDVEKYLGTWYEIARYDHRFEKGLVGVTANYSMREDGKIKVVNKGYKNSLNGELSTAIGKAKIPNPESEPAKLKVSFFWIFYGDYFVMELDKDYQWAIVGSNSEKYLWVLSRTPELDTDLYNELLSKIQNRGYDISKLIKVKQVKK